MIPATLILFSGNCGSSWFETLLCAHSDLASPVYEPLFGAPPTLRARFIQELSQDSSGPSLSWLLGDLFAADRIDARQRAKLKRGAGFVCKVRPGELAAHDVDAIPRRTLIWMRRRNLVKQALSSMKRLDLGISQFSRGEVSEPVVVDLQSFDRWLNEAYRANQHCHELFAACRAPKFVVNYEDLLAHRSAVMSSVTRRLGLANQRLFSNYYTKVTSDSLEQAVVNIDEFQTYCRHKGLGWEDHHYPSTI